MKKNYTLLITLLLVAIISFGQQIPREEVVLEIGTGTWCQYCPGAAMGADDLIEHGHDVAVIEYHSGDPYQNTASSARLNYYNIGSFPTAKFDGVLTKAGGSGTQSMYSQYLPLYNQRIAIPSSFSVDIYGTNSGQTYDITLVVKKVADFVGDNLVVQFALTESHIPENWFGMTEVNFVLRKMAPNHNGTPIDLEVGEEVIIELTMTLSALYDEENCEFVAFVQNNTSKEIAQAAKVMVLDLNPYVPPMAADFTVSDTMPCTNSLLDFTDQSQGNISTYEWEFPGGIPETSAEKNPVVYYPDAGDYDVSLTISNGLENVTTVKENYIHVHGPEATFAEVDVQCINYPAFELSQGEPEGGTYEGPGVDEEGFFHPEVAGVGEHILKYYVSDTSDCVDTAFQTVVVDACTGISEIENQVFNVYPNPSNGVFNLELNVVGQDFIVAVYNPAGQMVYSDNNVNANKKQYQLDISNMPVGIYYLNVRISDTQSEFRKIILGN